MTLGFLVPHFPFSDAATHPYSYTPLRFRLPRSHCAETVRIHALCDQGWGPYDPNKSLDDLDDCKLVTDFLLASKMIESETPLREGDPKMKRLYVTTGYALIEAVKALMRFEDKVSKLESTVGPLTRDHSTYLDSKLIQCLLTGIDLTRKSSQLPSHHQKHVSRWSPNRAGHQLAYISAEKHDSRLTACRAHLRQGSCPEGSPRPGDSLNFIKEA
jgi:hypothetical protein